MDKGTILVVGGAGYIGSHTNKMLRQKGYKTVVLDNLIRGDRNTVGNTPFIQGNMNCQSTLKYIFNHYVIDTVMHFAALTDISESWKDPSTYFTNNVSYTLNLLQAMTIHNVNNLIYSSSAAVFGQPQVTKVDEDHPCAPINPYGESKLMVEKLLTDFSQAHGMKFCSIRYFNAAGGDPEGKIKNYQIHSNNLIPSIMHRLKQGEATVKINGTDYPTHDGTCIRDFVHIEDIGSAHLLSMERLKKTGESTFYNLGNGQGYSVREVINLIGKITGKKINILECERRSGDPPMLIADTKKALKELEWKPRFHSLETMIEHTWTALDHLT
jgi:UDP-glucose 4-epimerase